MAKPRKDAVRAGRFGIRDRIVELRRVPARDLIPHPANWRRHPSTQRAALEGVLRDIGYAGALLAREVEGGLMLLDGHLRAETTPDMDVPVLVLDVTEEEGEKLLALLDPIGALATRNDVAARELLGRIETRDGGVQELIDQLLREIPAPPEAPAEFGAVDETLATEHRCPKCGYEWSGRADP